MALSMTRREMLQGVTALLGGVLSSSVAAAILGCGRDRAVRAPFVPRTLTAEQNELVATIAELIIPATDTPGARAAGVNEFVDLLLTDWLEDEERDRFLAGLASLDEDCVARVGRPFVDLGVEEQVAFLRPLDEEAAEIRRAAIAAGQPEIEDPPFFVMMKEWTLVGYYTSEIGMTQELQHLRVAGRYAGCEPLSVIGRAWA